MISHTVPRRDLCRLLALERLGKGKVLASVIPAAADSAGQKSRSVLVKVGGWKEAIRKQVTQIKRASAVLVSAGHLNGAGVGAIVVEAAASQLSKSGIRRRPSQAMGSVTHDIQ